VHPVRLQPARDPDRCPECGTRVAGIVRIIPDDEPPFCILDDDDETIPDVCLG
jgi:hypothetical protein